MKFAIFTTALAVFSGLVSSAPVADPNSPTNPGVYPNLVVEISTPDSGHVSNDSVYISRYTYSGVQYDTNALISYPFPGGQSGKCTFRFSNGWYAGGTRKVQLFSVGGRISPTDTYNHRPHRDNSYGIFTISEDGKTATWDNGKAPIVPCTSTTNLGFELVPQGDLDWAGWDINAGLELVAF